MTSQFQKRFDDLAQQAETIDSARTQQRGIGLEGTYVDANDLLNWDVKVRNLLSALCGTDSQHFKAFEKAEKTYTGETNHSVFRRLRAIFLAAKQDFEGGYLNSLKQLVQADVFDNELEQAQELLNSKYIPAAAVIAGVVLETAMRDMCRDKGLEIGSLNKMNADLGKAGVYNALTAKQITAIAEIRNNAAHGKGGFNKADVHAMIRDVQRILAERLT